jgi:hypothetical protein
MDLKKIIREELEVPKGVQPMHVVYFPSQKSVLDKYMWEHEDEFTLYPFVPDHPKNVSTNAFSTDKGLLEEVTSWMEDNVLYWNRGDEPSEVETREYYQSLLGEMVIRTFVLRVEEVTRTDSSFFEDL